MILKYLKRDLFQVIFHVTYRCNAKCKFCFNWKNINTNLQKELTLDEIDKFSKSLPNFSWLLLSGGEVFLRDDLVEIIEIFYKNNKISHLTIPTNGISDKIKPMTEEILNRCTNLTVTLAFSLDGLEKEHDEMRQVPCFKKLMENYESIQILRENPRFNVKFNTVISNQNHINLLKLINLIKELDPDMHTIDFLRGDVMDKSFKLPENLDEIISLIKENYNYYSGYSNIKKHSFFMKRASEIIQVQYLDLFKRIINQKKQVIPCKAYRLSLVLYPYGDVSFCEILPAFANIRKCDYNYKKVIGAGKDQKECIKCKKCYCYHPCYQYLNILYNPIEMIMGWRNVY